MNDFLKIYKKFKDIKDIADLIEDTGKLRYYYGTGQFEEMVMHIESLTKKYFIDTAIWNSVNRNMPATYEQAYINAENFLSALGAKIIIQQVFDYRNRITSEEAAFIDAIIKSM